MGGNDWQFDPAFEDLRQVAERLEAALSQANRAVLKAAMIDPQEVVDAFAATHARLLGLDGHGRKQLAEALEEKRVKTLTRDNIIAACVLSSAVALSHFKNQPRRVSGRLTDRLVERLRPLSTKSLTLGAYALASLYATLGAGLLKRARAPRRNRIVKNNQ